MPIQDFKCFAIIDYLKSVIDYSLYPTAISNLKSFTDYKQLNQLLITSDPRSVTDPCLIGHNILGFMCSGDA